MQNTVPLQDYFNTVPCLFMYKNLLAFRSHPYSFPFVANALWMDVVVSNETGNIQ